MKKQKEIKTDTAPAEAPPMPRKERDRGIHYLVAAITCGLAGIGLFIGYFITLNMLFGYVFIAPMLAAWWFYHKYKKSREEAVEEAIYSTKPVATGQVNSMNIYPADEGGVVFENTAKPEGQPKICENDGKPYFVHIWDIATKRLRPFMLPDTQYYDPRVFAERVLELPAHRRIFQRKQTVMQKLKPAILFLLIIALWIANLTIAPAPPAGA